MVKIGIKPAPGDHEFNFKKVQFRVGAIPSEPEIRYVSYGKCNHNINVITAEKNCLGKKKRIENIHCPWKRMTYSSYNT